MNKRVDKNNVSLIAIVVAIYTVEFFIMLILKAIRNPKLESLEIFIDSTVLVVTLFPIIYLFLFRPLIQQINERKLAEKQLKEQKKFTENLIENLTVPTFVLDSKHKVIIWNKALEDITGIKAVEVIGTDSHWRAFYSYKRLCLSDIVIDGKIDDLPSYYEVFAKSDIITEGLHSESWVPGTNGTPRYLFLDAAPIRNKDGELIAVIETLQDFTERKLAEERISFSEELHRQLIENANLGIIVCNKEGKITTANPTVLQILGSPSLEATMAVNVLTFPPMVEAGISESIRRCLDYGKKEIAEHIYTTKWGKSIYMRIHLSSLRKEDGEIAAVQALVEDFSERKQAEEKLRDTNQRLSALIEASPLAIYVLDTDFKVSRWNPAAERIFGYSAEEVIGSILPILPKKKDDIYTFIKNRAFAGEFLTGEETRRQKKDGTIIDVSISTSPLYNVSGKITAIMAIAEDITERKRMEKTLKQRDDRVQKELLLASSIQSSLFPMSIPEVPGVKLAITTTPAKEVGGDYCDLILINNNKLGIAIADVMGKGIPAALFMAMTYSFVRNYAPASNPASLVNGVNRSLYPHLNTAKRFITFFYGVFDPETKEFKYANAGHNPPIVYRAATEECETLAVKNFYLGAKPNASYKEGTVKLNQGDIVLFYTDGLVEGMNKDQVQFGKQHVMNLIKENSDQDAVILMQRINNEFNEFLGGEPLSDDITMIILKIVEDKDQRINLA